MTESTDLIVLPPKENILTVFLTDKGLDPVIEKIKAQVRAEVLDVSTEDGRRRIGALARQIGSAKMALKDMAMELTEDWRAKTKAVTSERTRMEAELDALRDEVKAPLDEYKEREDARLKAHENALISIEGYARLVDADDEMSSETIQNHMNAAAAEHANRDWQEFKARADRTIEEVLDRLTKKRATRKKWEDDQAELKRHREEQEKRDAAEAERKKGHEDAIADIRAVGEVNWISSTVEALRDRLKDLDSYASRKWEEFADAGKQAIEDARDNIGTAIASRENYDKEQAELESRRAQDAENERIKKEKEEADAKLEKAETARKNEHERWIGIIESHGKISPTANSAVIDHQLSELLGLAQSERDFEEFKDRAQDAFDKTEAHLRDILAKAKEREKKAADDAAVQRQKDIDAAAQKKRDDDAAAEAERAKDKAHKAHINNEIKDALEKVIAAAPSNPDDVLKEIVKAIAKGEIPHVKIQY